MNKELLVKLIPVAIIVVGTGILSVIFFGKGQLRISSPKKAGLQVESLSQEKLEVFIDGQLKGTTPFLDDNLKPGRISLELKSTQGSYATSLDLYENTRTTVLRQVSASPILSGGEVVWLEKIAVSGQSRLNVIGTPEGAKVFLEENEVGTIPYISETMDSGTYLIRITAPNYKEEVVRVSLQDGYQLTAEITLPIIPVPQGELKKMPEQETSYWSVFDLSSSNSNLTPLPASWVKAVSLYYQSNPLPARFDFYFDYQGNFYDKDGALVNFSDPTAAKPEPLAGQIFVLGYLGNANDQKISNLAEESLSILAQLLGEKFGLKVKILPTAHGWLRVRSTPNGTEVARVNEGEQYTLLEEVTGWVKIQVSDQLTGWVSSEFISKL